MSDKSNSKFPEKADVVIVGVGGIVGSMLAYWLAELGQKNIVGLEKSTIIPSDIASTAHASDFVYNTTHDKLGCWTTSFSRKFYEDNGFFLKKGGLEICRKGDDERWEELKRKVASGKAFGTNVRLISAGEAVEKFPLLEDWVLLRDFNCDNKMDIFTSFNAGIKVYKNTSTNNDLSFVAALCRSASGVVANDTGPTFIAGAVNCPVTWLLSHHTNPDLVRPQCKKLKIIKKQDISDILVSDVENNLALRS